MNQGAMRLDRDPARYNRTSATAMSRERRRGGRTAGMPTDVERQLAALQGEVATLKKDKGRMEQLLYRKAVDDATRSPSPHDAGDGNKWEKWAWRQRHQKGEESPWQGEGQSSPSRQSFTAKHQALSGSSSLNGSTQDLDTLEDSSEGRERLLAKKNRELTWTIRQLEKRCSALKTENVTLKRQREELELAEDKISKLQRRNTELTTLARRLETKAKTLQQHSTGKSNQPTGENMEHYKRVFARQRAKDLADHAQAILAKDKEIGHLQQELTVLQGQGQNGSLYSHEEELQHIITQAAKERLQMERTVCSRLAQNGELEADRFDGGDARVQNLQLQVETLSQAAGRVQELEASLQAEKTSQQALKEELRQASRRLSALEVELAEEKVSRAQLEEQLSNSNQRCSYLESELESQVVDNTDLTKRTSELQRQVSQLEQTQFESQGVHDQLTQLLIQNEELQTAKRAQENKVQHLQTVIQELEEELRQNPTEDLAATKHLLEEKEKTVQELLKHQKETEDSHRQTLHQLQTRLQELDSQHADGQLLCQRQTEQLKELSEKLAKKSDVPPEHSAPSVSAASVGIQVNIRTGTQKSVQTDTQTDIPRSEQTHTQKYSREADQEKRVNQIVKPVPIVGAKRSAFETVSPAAGVNGTPEPPPVVVAAPGKRTISPPVNHQSLAKELSSAGFHPIQEPDGSGDSWDEASTYTLPSHHDNDNPSPEPEPEPQSHTQQGLNGLEEVSGDADMDKPASEGSETAPTVSSEAAHDRKKLAVYIARYSYNPYDGPNDNPEAELSFQAGEYVYVYGDMDEDMFFQGELMDGSRGLVPSNFVERVADEDMPNWSPAQPSISDEDATHVSFQSEDEVSISQLVPDGSTNDNQPGTTALQLAPTLPDSFTDTLDSLQKPDASPNKTPVPWPQNLTVDKQLTNSLILKWDPADLPAEEVLHYAVYLNRELKAKVPPDAKPSALVEGVDIEKTYRVCVRTTTRTGQSLDPQATLLVGKDATLAPSNLQVSEVTPTSCELSWLPSNSSYAHSLVVNNGEPKILAPGVYKHSITGLQPGTLQKVEVRSEKSSTSLWDFIESKTWKRNENTSASVQFETLPGGPPDPPVNVTVEPGQEPHQVLISWLPVTIDTTGTSNGAVVQGYAVYSGQRKVAEVSEPTGDSVVVETSTLAGTTVGPILVRTVSSSGDSINSQSAVIPLSLKKMLYQRKHLPTLSSSQVITEEMPEKPTVRRESGKIQSIEMMYEGRTDDSSPESDISDEQVEQFEPSVGRTVTKSPQDGLPMPPGGLDRELQEKKPEIRPSFRSEVHSDSSNHSELSDIAEEAEEDLEEEVHSDSMSIDVPGLDHPAQPVHLTAKLSHPTSEDPGANTESDLEEPPLPSTKVKQGRRASPTQHWRDQRRGHASPVPDTELPEEDDYSSGGESDVTLRDSMEGDRSAPRWFVALFDYDPMTMSPNPDAADEELPFREGQLIKVYGDKDGDGFFMGDVEGRCGVVPCNLVEEIEDDYRLQQLRNSNNVLSPDKLDALPGGYQRDDAHIQNGHLSQLQSPVRRMRALFDYDPQEMSPNVDTEMELPFYQGDIIDVVGEMDEDGFFMGEMEGRRGLVPSNFLEDITTCDQADNYAPQPTGHDRSYRSPSHIQDRDISPQADRREAQPPKKKKGLLSKGKKLFKKLGGSVEGKSKR